MRVFHRQNDHVRLIKRIDQIQQYFGLLHDLAVQSGQPEAVDDIRYYLEKPGLLTRKPVLALVFKDAAAKEAPPTQEALQGAVLLFRYKFGKVNFRIFTSNDRSGRRNVIAPVEHRLEVVRAVTDFLERRKAHVVMLSLRCVTEDCAAEESSFEVTKWGTRILRQRTTPDYLPLAASYEATLAAIGKRTRTHMRYYRKRAQELLGCTFEPELRLDVAGLFALNACCTHQLPSDVLLWRLRVLSSFSNPLLVALRARDGDLLGVIAGRRLGDQTEVLWQMNRGDLAGHSLSLVLRSHLIEHEISRGMQRLYLDGGTAHSLRNSFVTATVTDVAVLRRSALTYAIRKSARFLIPWDNELAHLLVAGANQKSVATEERHESRVAEQHGRALAKRHKEMVC